jgi:hypothetical protein
LSKDLKGLRKLAIDYLWEEHARRDSAVGSRATGTFMKQPGSQCKTRMVVRQKL